MSEEWKKVKIVPSEKKLEEIETLTSNISVILDQLKHKLSELKEQKEKQDG